MSRPPNAMMEALLNHVEGNGRIVAHMVPTRIIRIIDAANDGHTFRIEQLVEHGGFGSATPRGAWKTLSTHNNAVAGGALGVAFQAAFKAQHDLVAKLKKRIANRSGGLIKP